MSDTADGLIPDPQNPGAFFVRIGGADQSWLDPSDPTRLEFDYMQRVASHLDHHGPAGQRMRVVHIGGAGMSLARYVAATRPTSAQIVLEPDAALTEQVRALAPLPKHSGIKVRPLDGRTGLAAMPDDYADVIIVDAFAGSQVPGDLVTAEAFAGYDRVLAGPDPSTGLPSGALVMNVTDRSPFEWLGGLLAGAAGRFGTVMVGMEGATLKGRRKGNIIVAATHGRFAVAGLLADATRAIWPYRLVTGAKLERFVGSAPFTDANPVPSPVRLGEVNLWDL